MATITTDTFLDDGTARTAGENWTLNGATLTIRTDTRVHANAPAGMTGSIGALTCSSTLGGGIILDGTKVRWVSYTGGTGYIPPIGSFMVQGSTIGYFLGVWESMTSAPLTSGPTPSSGYIKLREVTGGRFLHNLGFACADGLGLEMNGKTTNTLGSGGDGTVGSPADAPGWIEVVFDNISSWQFYRLGTGLKAEGQWFELGATNGTIGQTFNVPTNGGGNTTHVYGVQIETSPDSGVYEWWPALASTVGWSTTYLTTDARAKYVQSVGNGVVRIGSDGTNNIGFVPPAGCKVRIPGLICRFTTSANRSLNSTPGTGIGGRPGSSGTGMSNATVDVRCVMWDWYFSFLNSYSVYVRDLCCEGSIGFQNNQIPFNVDGLAIGCVANNPTEKISLTSSFNGGTLTNVSAIRFYGADSNTGAIKASNASNIVMSNVNIGILNRTTASAYAVFLDNVTNFTINNLKCRGNGLAIRDSKQVTTNNLDYIDRLSGATNASLATYSVYIETSSDIKVDGISFGINGTLPSCNPAGGVVWTTTNLGGITVRNGGTRTSPLHSSAVHPQFLWRTSNDNDVRVQRIFVSGVTQNVISTSTGSRNCKAEQLHTSSQGSNVSFPMNNTYFKAIGTYGTTSTVNVQPSGTYGQHFYDGFISDTVGYFRFQMNEPSPDTLGYTERNFTGAKTGFTGTGGLVLTTAGEFYTFELPYFVKGHTGFGSVNPISFGPASGSGLMEYQIDKGTGYSGTWKTLSQVNIGGESGIDPDTGFRFKLRYSLAASGSALFTSFSIATTTTLAVQSAGLYPLDTSTLSFTGLQPGSEVRCYQGSDPATAVEIGGIESTVGSTFSFTHSSGGQVGFIRILAMGYQPISIDPYTFKSTDDSILIQQVVDRNYSNPA